MAEPTHASPDHKRAAPGHALARLADTHHPPAPELQPDSPGGDVTARHASLLADRRLSGERVRLLQHLQHGYGNGHVARVVQRVVDAPAPPGLNTHLEPDQDPKFQQVEGKIRQVGAKQKQHASPKAKAAEAQAAAHGPANDVKSKAAAKQVGAMAAQEPGAFDRAAFIAAVKKSIDAKTPKNLEEADDFKESGKAGEVKGEVTGLVTKGKQEAEGGIKAKTQAAPDTSGVQPKPVAPMGEEKAGPQPPDVGAKQAIPDRKSPAETSLDQGPAQVNDQMAHADVTEQQLEHSNEPTFETALGQKKQAEEHSRTAPPQFKAQEQQILTQASSQAAAEAQKQSAGMHRARAGAQSHVGSHKDAAKARDEAKRAEVATRMEAIYSSTKTEVQAILDGLEGKVNAAFDKGEKVARDAFENHVDTRMRAYKKERYSGLRGKARWGWDKLTGMPSEVNAFYVEGRDLYLEKMDAVIGEVADIVGKELTAAKARIARGRQDIDQYAASLPRELQQVGKAAQKEIAGKFDQLESDVNEKQDSLVQSLAEKYCAARDAVDDRIKEMQAANKGLVDAVIDAVGGVIRTILQLKDMLLGVLRKAADVIGTLIKDPIGFLGNLVGAVKQGLNQFVSNIGTHLEQGLMGWLFGAVGQAGIKLPDSFDLKGILSLVLQVLGLAYDNIRGIAVSLVGEKVVSGIEGTVKVLMTLAKEGPAGLWEWIKDKVAEIDIQGMVLGAIKDFVITRIITAGVTWLIGLLNPAAGFIKACKMIYDIIMFFVERGSQIMEFVNSVLDSIGAIATGNIGAAANMVENSLAKILPLAIGFLASLLGLDGIGEKIKQIIEKIRAPITKLVTAVLTPILKPFKKLFDKGANFVKGVVAEGKALGKKAIDKVKRGAKSLLGNEEAAPENADTEKSRRVKAKAHEMLAPKLSSPLASIDNLKEIVGGVLTTLRAEGLKRLDARPRENAPGKYTIIAEASPPEPVAQAEVHDPELEAKIQTAVAEARASQAMARAYWGQHLQHSSKTVAFAGGKRYISGGLSLERAQESPEMGSQYLRADSMRWGAGKDREKYLSMDEQLSAGSEREARELLKQRGAEYLPQRGGAHDRLGPGSAKLSHSEKHALEEGNYSPIGFQKNDPQVMCGDCQRYFMREAKAGKRLLVVATPSVTHVFLPDGTMRTV